MKIDTLFTSEQIAGAVRKMAVQLVERFGDDRPVKVLSLLNGALLHKLLKQILLMRSCVPM